MECTCRSLYIIRNYPYTTCTFTTVYMYILNVTYLHSKNERHTCSLLEKSWWSIHYILYRMSVHSRLQPCNILTQWMVAEMVCNGRSYTQMSHASFVSMKEEYYIPISGLSDPQAPLVLKFLQCDWLLAVDLRLFDLDTKSSSEAEHNLLQA